MSDVTMTFNGLSSTATKLGILQILDIERNILPGTEEYTKKIEGMDGVYDLGFDRPPLVIPVSFLVGGDTLEQVRTYAREIASWLEQRKVKELTFSDEPDIRYLARITGAVPQKQIIHTGECKVNFFVPSSYAESKVIRTVTGVFQNEGTADAPCVVSGQVNANISELRFNNQATGEYILIDKGLTAGDVFSIDTAKHLVLINGVDSREFVTYNSDYFVLPEGQNEVTVAQANVTFDVSFRERWK